MVVHPQDEPALADFRTVPAGAGGMPGRDGRQGPGGGSAEDHVIKLRPIARCEFQAARDERCPWAAARKAAPEA